MHHLFASSFHKKFNVNQIEFFTKLLESNDDLKSKIQIEDLQYFIDLIALHGKFTEFLEIFKIFLTKNLLIIFDPNLENNKKVLSVLFDDYNIEIIHVIKIIYLYIYNDFFFKKYSLLFIIP